MPYRPFFTLSTLMGVLLGSASAGVQSVRPSLETRPIIDLDAEDAPEGARLGDADDPAIWLHPRDPALSLVAEPR